MSGGQGLHGEVLGTVLEIKNDADDRSVCDGVVLKIARLTGP